MYLTSIEHIFNASYAEIIDNGYRPQKNGDSTISRVYKKLEEGRQTLVNYPLSIEAYFQYYNSNNGTSEWTNTHKKLANIVNSSLNLNYVDKKDFGTIVYSVHRFIINNFLKTITIDAKRSQWLGIEGHQYNFFIKITHKYEIKEKGVFYCRFIDRNTNIGAFFITKEKVTNVKVNDCIGISCKIRCNKKNKYTAYKETLLMSVEIMENYGSK